MSKSSLKSAGLLPWFVVGLAALFYMYQFVLRVSPSVMTADLMQAFAVNGCALGVLSATYYNAYALMQIPLGIAMDRFGPRIVLALACLTAACGTLIFAQAETLALASFGRVLIGAGAACGFIGTLKVSTLYLPPHFMSQAVGLTMILGTLGGGSGMPLRYLMDSLSWRGALMAIAFVGVALAVLLYVGLNPRSQRLAGRQNTDTHAYPLRLFEKLYKILSTPQAWVVSLFGCLMYVPLAAIADLWGPPYFAERYHIDRSVAATLTTALYLGVAVGSPVIALFSERIRSRRIPMFLGALMAFCIYTLMIYIENIPLSWMYILMFFAGFSFGGQPFVFSTITQLMPLSMSGLALGFMNTIVMMSGVIFEPLVGYLLDRHAGEAFGPTAGVPIFTIADYQFALMPVPLVLLIAMVLPIWMKETHPTHQPVKGLAPQVSP